MVSARRVLVLALLASANDGCKSRHEPEGAATSAAATLPVCPPESLMEELHASAFYFQHGPTDGARRHLVRARALTPRDADAVSTNILGRLSEISRRIESEPAWAAGETEYVRIALGDWSCLPESLHNGFHERL